MISLFITWNPSPQLFDADGFGIRWYGLLFALGFFLAYTILYFIMKKENVSPKYLDWLTLYVFIATLIGARLGHCFFYEWDYYSKNPVEILMVWEGGLASHGAAIAIVLALLIYVRRYKVNVWWLFDRVAMAIPVAAAFVRFGNLMNSEIFGKPADLPWAFVFLRDPDANITDVQGNLVQLVPRHPTQLYEAFAYLLITLVLVILYRKMKGHIRPGLFVGIFLTMMFTARFLIEFLKEVQVDFEKTMHLDMGQYLSIPFVLLGIGFIIHSQYRKSIPSPPGPWAERNVKKH